MEKEKMAETQEMQEGKGKGKDIASSPVKTAPVAPVEEGPGIALLLGGDLPDDSEEEEVDFIPDDEVCFAA